MVFLRKNLSYHSGREFYPTRFVLSSVGSPLVLDVFQQAFIYGVAVGVMVGPGVTVGASVLTGVTMLTGIIKI